jgi:hypothetical protein
LSAVEVERKWVGRRARRSVPRPIEVKLSDLQEFFEKVRPVARAAGFEVLDEAPSSVADLRGGGLSPGIVGLSLYERGRSLGSDSIWAHPVTRLCEVLAGVSLDGIGVVLVSEGTLRTVAEVSPLAVLGAVLVGDGILRSIVTTYRSDLLLVTAYDATPGGRPLSGFPNRVRLTVRLGKAVTFEGRSARHVRKLALTEEGERLAGSVLEQLCAQGRRPGT